MKPPLHPLRTLQVDDERLASIFLCELLLALFLAGVTQPLVLSRLESLRVRREL